MQGLLKYHCWSFGTAALTLYYFISSASATCQTYGDALPACRCVKLNGSLEVDCSSSGLTSIPADIPPDATVLNLSGNLIAALEADVWKRLANLRSLDLSYNLIRQLKNDSLLGLEELQYLNLNGNSIPYDAGYASGSMNSLDHLETLHILTDPCPSLFPDLIISGLVHLRELSVHVPDSGRFGAAWSNLMSLDSLYLSSRCSATRSLTVDDIGSLYPTPLRRLSLRNARLNHIEPDALKGFNETLKKLDISCNYIDNVPDVIAAFARTKLDTLLADNCVSTFMPLRLTSTTLAALQTMNLTILSLANNMALEIELTASSQKLKPTNIQYLRIGYNEVILSVVDIKSLFHLVAQFFFKLKVLDTSGILNFYIADEITNCIKEDPLFADGKKTWESDHIVHPAPKMPLWLWSLLVILRYENHRIITLPPLLTRIYFEDAGKQFSEMSCPQEYHYSIFSENNLIIFDASGTHLHTIACNITGFSLLKFVDASRMNLEKYSHFFFSDRSAPGLEWLDLSYNYLGSFFYNGTSKPLSSMSHVMYLDLSYNAIHKLSEDFFDHCSSLKILNLSGNSMTNWSVSVRSLRNLEVLNLSGNPLESIKKPYLDQFDELQEHGNLKSIYMSNVSCKCDLEFILWLHTTKVFLPDFTCSDSSLFPGGSVPAMAMVIWTCIGVYAMSAICSILIVVVFSVSFKWRLKYLYYKLKQYFTRSSDYWHVSTIRVYLAYHESESQRAGLVQQYLQDRMNIVNVVSRSSFLFGEPEFDQMAWHIDRCHFVVLLASARTISDPKSQFELYMSLEKGACYILPVLVADIKSYDELPRVLKKLLLMNNHLLWQSPVAGSTSDLNAENEHFFTLFDGSIRNLVHRLSLTRENQPGIAKLSRNPPSLDRFLGSSQVNDNSRTS